MLQRLIYFSERTPVCGDLAKLVDRAASRNRTLAVTGLLVADATTFLQVLEGPRDDVSSLFQSICRDPRHARIVLVEGEEIAGVSYPDWGMGRLDDVPKLAAMWARMDSTRPFDPWSMRAREIKDFLRLATFDLLNTRAPVAAAI